MLLEKSLSPDKKSSGSAAVLLWGVIIFSAVSYASTVGGESGAYLRYPVGAAALAMGGAGSACPGAFTPWWNPALVGRNKERRMAAGFGFRSLGQTDGFGSVEFRVPPRLGMGFFLLYRGDPFIDNLYDENENPLESAAFTSFTAKTALSYQIQRNLYAGFNLSILYEQLPCGYSQGNIDYMSELGIGSFDFALSYRFSEKLVISAILKEVNAYMNWNFRYGIFDYGVPHEDRMLPVFILGGSYRTAASGRPFICNMDLRNYIIDGQWKKLMRPQAALSAGCEWQYWKTVFLRMGMGDLPLNGNILSDSRRYFREFSLRFTGGICVDLSAVRPGLFCNYGFGTDKVWAGIDQQLDLTYVF